MVCLEMTPAIVKALEILSKHGELPDALTGAQEPSLDSSVIGNPISHGQILEISTKLKRIHDSSTSVESALSVSYHLDDLLRGSKIYIEAPKPKPEPVTSTLSNLRRYTDQQKTSEYKALMARLRREEESRAYERMTGPPVPTETFSQRFPNASHRELFPAHQADIGENDDVTYADVNRQMALIINILISVVACSVAIWLAARHWSTPSRLGLSMGGSGMIGVAEIVVYTGYLRRVKEAKEKGKNEVEIKEIIKTWVIGGEDEKKNNQDQSVLIKSKESQDDSFRKRKAKRK